jgi:glutaredoxin 3
MADIEIFSGQNCGYCVAAKKLLEIKGLAYTDYDISVDQKHRQEYTRRLPRARAIPQIFIDGDHIGGYEDLVLLNTSGRLAKLTEG